MDTNYSLSDISAALNGRGQYGDDLVTLLLLFGLMNGNGFGFGGRNCGQYGDATTQEILYNQHFDSLDNKMDRGFTSIGNGISDATFALNNTIVNGNNMVAGTVVNESRGIQDKLCNLNTSVHAEGEATRAMMQQNKIEALRDRISQLELAQATCGIVRYPMAMSYNAGGSPFCNNGGCGCGNI